MHKMKSIVVWILISSICNISTVLAARPYWDLYGPNAKQPVYSLKVEENQPNGTFVWDSKPVDPDGGDVIVTVEWLLPNKRGCRDCVIVNSDGTIEVYEERFLNYELWDERTPGGPHAVGILTATDSDGETTNKNYDLQIELTLTDIQEAPFFRNVEESYYKEMPEEQVEQANVRRIRYVDEDADSIGKVKFTWKATPPGPFGFDPIEPCITYKVTIYCAPIVAFSNPEFDYFENSEYLFDFTITDGLFTTYASMTLYILPMPHPPRFENLPMVIEISEFTEPGDSIFTVDAWDANNDTFSFLIDTFGAPFQIDELDGTVKLTDQLDYESGITSYSVAISAEDISGNITDPTFLTINILNENEPCSILDLPVTHSILDNITMGFMIHNVTAEDVDGDVITYTLTMDPPDAPFTMEQDGAVYFKSGSELNGAIDSSYQLVVDITDGEFTDQGTITVEIVVVNTAAEFFNLPSMIEIGEDDPGGRIIATIEASDRHNDRIMFALADSIPTFTITPEDGDLTLVPNPGLDFEKQSNYYIIVTATEHRGNLITKTYVNITILNVNEPPKFTNLPGTIYLKEDVVEPMLIFDVNATDQEYNPITFSLTCATSIAFSIDQSGQVFLASNPNFDFETIAAHDINIEITDAEHIVSSHLIVEIENVEETPYFLNLPTEILVDESVSVGLDIFAISSYDDDGNDLSHVLINSFPEEDIFTIQTDGTIVLSKPLDFESVMEYNLSVSVQDTTLLHNESYLVIIVQNVDEPPFISEPASESMTVNIEELDPPGTSLYNISAFDPEESMVTFSLVAQPPGPFQVDNSGNVKLFGKLDYYQVPTYRLNISISDGVLTSSTLIQVEVIEIPEPPEFRNLPDILYLSEFSNSTVFTVDIEDPENDTFTLSIIDGAGTQFTIDTVTGVLSVPSSPGLDFETMSWHNLTISALDERGSTSSNYLYVRVIDEQEPPVITNLPSTINIAEDISTGPSTVFFLDVFDPEHDTLEFTLTSFPDDGIFFIDDNITGSLRHIENPSFDFETLSTYHLAISVTDGNFPPSTNNLTVNILDVNEAPTIWNLPAKLEIFENVYLLTSLFMINATDEDYGDSVKYYMDCFPPDGYNKFVLNKYSGEFFVGFFPGFDASEVDTYNITITVEDSHGNSTHGNLSVKVISVNDPPVFNVSYIHVTVDEELAIGSHIPVSFYAYDPDETGEITYSLDQTYHSTFFNLHQEPALTVLKRLDRDHRYRPSVYTFDILATDGAGATGRLRLAIYVKDINDNAPIFQEQIFYANVPHFLYFNTSLIQLSVRDKDSAEENNKIIKFSLTGRAAHHFIVNQNGILVNRFNNYYILGQQEQLSVFAYDNGNPPLVGKSTIIIRFTRIPAPVIFFKEKFYNFEIWQGADQGNYIGIITGLIGDTKLLQYRLINTTWSIGIEHANGILYTRGVASDMPTIAIKAIALDNSLPQKVSRPVTIRVDTYNPSLHLFDIIINTTVTSVNLKILQMDIQKIIPKSIVRFVFINKERVTEDGKFIYRRRRIPRSALQRQITEVSMIILKSNKTFLASNVHIAKDIYELIEVLPYLIDANGSIRKEVFHLPVVTILPHNLTAYDVPLLEVFKIDTQTALMAGLILPTGLFVFSSCITCLICIAGILRRQKRLIHVKSRDKRLKHQLTDIHMAKENDSLLLMDSTTKGLIPFAHGDTIVDPLSQDANQVNCTQKNSMVGNSINKGIDSSTIIVTHGMPPSSVAMERSRSKINKVLRSKAESILVSDKLSKWDGMGSLDPKLLMRILANQKGHAPCTEILPGFAKKPDDIFS